MRRRVRCCTHVLPSSQFDALIQQSPSIELEPVFPSSDRDETSVVKEGSGKASVASGEEAREDRDQVLGQEAIAVEKGGGRRILVERRRERVDLHSREKGRRWW